MAAPHCQTILAATNKFLAKSNKSQTGVEATKKRIPPKEAVSAALCVLARRRFHKTMMLQEAKSIARHLALARIA
jgi:N-glycosylase/DNA lyase